MTDPARTLHELDLDVFVAAPPETVWQFWVDPDRMREWWGVAHELDPRPGGIYRVTMSEAGPTMLGEYVALEPPTRLVFLFGWEGHDNLGVPPSSTKVEVTLTAEAGGTRVRLVHRELPDEQAALEHGKGWSHVLAELQRANT